ncbi:hypothetical protein RYZ26_06725 [Terasakiella sp. A23]|uniref:hypothetical protein n=1 Tax=Terasakiella sp. FCG-A23 TaxID=3080561 RepID=UPI0029556FD9|nr:hypothetical protein [Terasakiella sp. A23]MDV7339280.1 hypothetical protein [Terasakiella sp. A23]
MSTGTVDFDCKGPFDEVTAKGVLEGDAFIKVYHRLFESRKNSASVFILVNILEFQNQLSVESFAQILHEADESHICHINMVVVTLDPARPLIGEMLEALSTNFIVNIKITFTDDLEKGRDLVQGR